MTVAEVAARVQCHPHTVRRWIWDRKLRAVKIGDLVRVPEDEIKMLARPVAARAEARKAGASRKGALALIQTMRKLRKDASTAEVRAMERMIDEATQPADWRNPVG